MLSFCFVAVAIVTTDVDVVFISVIIVLIDVACFLPNVVYLGYAPIHLVAPMRGVGFCASLEMSPSLSPANNVSAVGIT